MTNDLTANADDAMERNDAKVLELGVYITRLCIRLLLLFSCWVFSGRLWVRGFGGTGL